MLLLSVSCCAAHEYFVPPTSKTTQCLESLSVSTT